MAILLKRAYEAASPTDGRRVLVDRLWPRGLTKDKAAIDLWLKDIAPSNELRKWFGHDPDKWPGFVERYRSELALNPALQSLINLAHQGPLCLVYGAKDETHNQAVVLKEVLESKESTPPTLTGPSSTGS